MSVYNRPDYDKEKIAIYMTHYAYKTFHTLCGKNLFRKLTVTNIRYDHKRQNEIQKKYKILKPCDFMIETPESHLKHVLNIIKLDEKLSQSVFYVATNQVKKQEVKKIQKPLIAPRHKKQNKYTKKQADTITPQPKISCCNGCELSCSQIYSRRGDMYIPLHIPQHGIGNYFLDKKYHTPAEALRASIELAQKCQWNTKTR